MVSGQRTRTRMIKVTANTSIHQIYFTLLFCIFTTILSQHQVDSFACDYVKYPQTGCENKEEVCDEESRQCNCPYAFAPRLHRKCLTYVKIHEKCYTSRQCLTLGAKCLNDSMQEVFHEHNYNAHIQLDSKDEEFQAGFCRCPNNTYFSHITFRCELRVYGSSCRQDFECTKGFMFCDEKDHTCKCEKGFNVNMETDTCYSLRLININSIETYVPGPICDTWDSATGRCKSHWDTGRSWSSLMWKLAVLCVVLILLMMLLGGIQKARQNENFMSLSRAMEELQVRNTRYNSGLRNSRWPPPAPEFGILRGSRSSRARVFLAPLNDINDDPPPYEEAVSISTINNPASSPPQYRDDTTTTTPTTTTTTTTNNTSDVVDNGNKTTETT